MDNHTNNNPNYNNRDYSNQNYNNNFQNNNFQQNQGSLQGQPSFQQNNWQPNQNDFVNPQEPQGQSWNGASGNSQMKTNPYDVYVQTSENTNKNTKNKKPKKVKKKKKHTFLKFLLFNIILVCVIVFGSKFFNNMAQKELDEFATSYPFIFENEMDTTYYVTGDFDAPVSYELEDKEYKVSWTSSKENYISFDEDGNATITRPTNKSVDVVVTQTYKKLLGKGKVDYTLTLIPTNTISKENVDVVTINELKEQTYENEMEAKLLDNGDVRYMYGDFDNTYVYSVEDALVVLESYRNELGISESFVFELKTINSSLTTTSYVFDTYYNDMLLNGETIQILVDKNNELMKILNNVKTKESKIITTTNEINEQEIQEIFATYLKENNINKDFVIGEDETTLKDGSLSKSYFVILENGIFYYATINQETKEVVSFKDLCSRSQIQFINQDCEGEDEKGNNHNFVGSFKMKYVLYNIPRDIGIYENKGYWESLWESMKERTDFTSSIADIILNGTGNVMVSSDTNKFDNPIAVQTYMGLQNVYDWYNDNFGLNSYNGRGSKIVAKIDYDNGTDNAAWLNIFHYFVICPNGNLKYSTSVSPEVLAHEYTHAVFETRAGFEMDDGYELTGINESYADVMGILATNKTSWLVGENETIDGEYIYFRDIKNFNSENLYLGRTYPKTYKGENWVEEGHTAGVVLSHVAYQMTEDELFSWDDVAKIWYESMSYGYDNSSTFVDARKNLIQAASELGYGKEHQDAIAYFCDLVEIYDTSYEITTERFLNGNQEVEDDENLIKTMGSAIQGHMFLDDDLTSTFLIATSPIGAIFGEAPIIIYQLENGASKEEIQAMEDKLTIAVNEYMNNDSEFNMQFEIVYDQLSPTTFSIVKKIVKDTDDYVKNVTFEAIGVGGEDELDNGTSDFINIILKLIFIYEITDTTAYDFYSGLGIAGMLE